MRDVFPGRRQALSVKTYRKQQDKERRRTGDGIREQSVARDRADLAVAVVGLAVGVMMERDNN